MINTPTKSEYIDSPFSSGRKLAIESTPDRLKRYFENGTGGFILSGERSDPTDIVKLGTNLNPNTGKFEVVLDENGKPIPCTRRERANHLAKQLYSREKFSRGLYFIPLFGVYDDNDTTKNPKQYSFFIPYTGKNLENHTFEGIYTIVLELAKAYNQESIIVLTGMGKGYVVNLGECPDTTKRIEITFESISNYRPFLAKGTDGADNGHIVWFIKYGGFLTFDSPCFKESRCALFLPITPDSPEKGNRIKAKVRKLGFGIKEYIGRFIENDSTIDERILLVFDITIKKAKELGKEFGLSSIIYKDQENCREICISTFTHMEKVNDQEVTQTYYPDDIVRVYHNTYLNEDLIKEILFTRRGPVGVDFELYEVEQPRPSYFQDKEHHKKATNT